MIRQPKVTKWLWLNSGGHVRLADETLAWESECGVETGDFHSEPQAVELATRCALESATLW